MTDEWQTVPQIEDEVPEGMDGSSRGAADVGAGNIPAGEAEAQGQPATGLDAQSLSELEQPLNTGRESASAQRLVVAFSTLQSNLWQLAHGQAVDPGLVQLHIDLLARDRKRIEAALAAKRDVEAWGLFNAAWLRFAQIVPDDRLTLLLDLRIQSSHQGTGTQTLIAWVQSLRNEVVMLAGNPQVDKAQLHGYVCLLEQGRVDIEAALAERHFDEAWAMLRGLWEQRFDVLPAGSLEAERQALVLLAPSAGRGNRLKELKQALDQARQETDVARQRSLLAWVKREINESAQSRYWRYDIYKRRVQWTAYVMIGLLLVLAGATVVVLRAPDGTWYQQLALLLGVSLAGSLGGAVSGLRTSEEISQQRLSAAYFKQAVTFLRMLVGAAAALAVYFLLASGLVSVTFGTGSQDMVYLALGFVAGFSERFFLEALDKAGTSAGLGASQASAAGSPGALAGEEAPPATDEPASEGS